MDELLRIILTPLSLRIEAKRESPKKSRSSKSWFKPKTYEQRVLHAWMDSFIDLHEKRIARLSGSLEHA